MSIDTFKKAVENSGWGFDSIVNFLGLSEQEIEKIDNKSGKYYLVQYESNWADELYVYGFALLKEYDKQYFNLIKENNLPLTHHIGTNQNIKYNNLNDLLSRYIWREITIEEYNTINDLLGNRYGKFFYPEIIEDELELDYLEIDKMINWSDSEE